MQNLYSPVRIRSSPPRRPPLRRRRRTWVVRIVGWLAIAVALAGCTDYTPPPFEGPRDLPRWSTAPHVRWAPLADAGNPARVVRPLCVFVEVAGGPLDRLAADPDVVTFLTDRFVPYFLVPEAAPDLPSPGVLFLDAGGCVLGGPAKPETPAAFIAVANEVVQSRAAGVPGRPMRPAPTRWGFDLGPWPDHPLRARCESAPVRAPR